MCVAAATCSCPVKHAATVLGGLLLLSGALHVWCLLCPHALLCGHLARTVPFGSAMCSGGLLTDGDVAGCVRSSGSTANADPGVSVPTVAYRPGEVMAVTWQLTIPHTADNRDTGVRIAMHYGPGDSFDRNVHRSFQLASVAPHSPCPAVV